MPWYSTIRTPSCQITHTSLKLANNFTPTPASSSTTPTSSSTPLTQGLRPWRPKWAINLAFFEDYQPLDSPRTTSTGILSTFAAGPLRNKFFNYAKANRLEWGFNQKKFKVKIDADVNSSNRLARQPFYTLLEMFSKILPEEEQGPRGQLQSDLNTLQIWPTKEGSGPRFARRKWTRFTCRKLTRFRRRFDMYSSRSISLSGFLAFWLSFFLAFPGIVAFFPF